jgi:hypothetical protein
VSLPAAVRSAIGEEAGPLASILSTEQAIGTK